MGLFIEKIHTVLADLEGKNIAAKHPPEQVDRVLYLIIVDLFNKYLDHYVKTKKIDNYLLPFRRQKTITITGGVGDLPTDYAHYRQVYLQDGKTLVDMVPDKFWDGRVNSKLDPPSAGNVIGRIEYAESPVQPKLEVVPSAGISSVKMFYFKKPTEPKYNYSQSGTRYVYQEAGSVDVEFPIGLYPDIVNRLLNTFGIVLREGQLIQVTEMLKNQEQAK